MRLYRATFIAFIAASAFGFTNQALAAQESERAVIVVTVDENGRTIFRCTGIECETVDCSGNGQLMASGTSYVVRREGQDSCATAQGSPADEAASQQAEEEIIDIILVALEAPVPESPPADPIVIETELVVTTEPDAAQQTGESDVVTP